MNKKQHAKILEGHMSILIRNGEGNMTIGNVQGVSRSEWQLLEAMQTKWHSKNRERERASKK